MSVTPVRPSSSAAQSTRRVSFSPVVRNALDSVEQRRRKGGTALLPTDVAEYSEETPTDINVTDVPSTTSHRTRLATNTDAAAPMKSVGMSPARQASEGSHATTAAAPLTTVEFSLKDIPLDGKMAPPVWREASPGRGHSSRRASPARGNSPASARLTQLHVPASSSPGDGSPVSDTNRNPYTDVARDSANLLRRQRVVRTFFDSHEDAVRLYIRLQQLLAYRDLCHHEFQQRQHFMNSDEERQRAVAARAQRMAAQEQEIQRIKAALATADVTGPEFASSMNSLYSTRSGTPSERSVKRAGEAKTRVGSSVDKDATASLLAAATKALISPSPNTARRGKRDTKSAAAARPPPSPRHATPKAALEAWRRRSQSQELPSSASTSLEDKAAAEHPPKHQQQQHQGYTPQDSTMDSDVALQLPGHSAAPRAAIAMVLPVRQTASPLPPRQAAPFGNSTSDVPPLPPTSDSKGGRGGSTVQASTSSSPSSTWSLRLTPQSSTGDATKQKPRSALPPPSFRVPTPTTQAKALPSGPVAGLVTPPRYARPPQPPAALSPSHLTPDRAARQPPATATASTDSPLARFRRQQGYEDPVQHYRTQRSNNTTPLRSQSSLGSARRSPPLVQGRVGGEAETGRPDSLEKAAARLVDVAPRVAAAADDAKQKKKEERPVGAGTALRRAAGAPLPSRRTEAPVEKLMAPPTGKANGGSASRGSSLSPERRAAILQRAALRTASPPASRSPKDIRSWSPVSPPQQATEGSSEGVGAGLVSSAAKSPQSSSPADASLQDATLKNTAGGAAAAAGADRNTSTRTASRPGGASVWDELAALERRVGGLEGRTAELERNAAKWAVLDAIRLLRERVTLLEERTLILERDGGNDEAAAGQLEWQRS